MSLFAQQLYFTVTLPVISLKLVERGYGMRRGPELIYAFSFSV